MIFLRLVRATAIALVISIACFASSASAASPADDKDKVVETVRQMFVALTNDDSALFKSVTSAGFYAFDVGKRFSGDELVQLVRNAHASGKVYAWEVTGPEARVHSDTAWVTYVNRGSIKDAAGVRELSWLESAVLRKDKGIWRIHFFHSTRIPSE